MNHYVNLVQRGISSQAHAVSGKSGKLYGTAVYIAALGGVAIKMTIEEYSRDAHDLIGNTAGAQQWVPEFVTEGAGDALNRGHCGIPAGCTLGENGRPAPATHFWGSHVFCGAHAPSNAARIDGQPSLATVPTPPPVRVEEVRPVIIEKGAPAQLPPEHLPPPAVASEDVDTIKPTPPPAITTVPFTPATMPAPEPTAAASIPAPAPATPPEPQPKAVDVIAQAVATALATTLPGALANMESRIIEKLRQPALKKAQKRTGGPDLAPSAFKLLQAEAKDLGINTYGKSAETIKGLIAEKKAA